MMSSPIQYALVLYGRPEHSVKPTSPSAYPTPVCVATAVLSTMAINVSVRMVTLEPTVTSIAAITICVEVVPPAFQEQQDTFAFAQQTLQDRTAGEKHIWGPLTHCFES